MKQVLRFLKDKSGATAIEYGLIASLIAIAVIASAGLVGTNLKASFNKVSGNMR